MALVTQPVTGTFYYADGTAMAGAYLLITLSNPTTDSGSPGTLPPAYVEDSTIGDGSFSINLWPNERGVETTYYSIEVSYIDKVSGRLVKSKIGKFQVPDSSGPHNIEDLLAEQISLVDDWGLITESVSIIDNWGSI